MKYRNRILAGFSLFILLSIIMIIINIIFLNITARKIKAITTQIFTINNLTQESSLIIFKIHADVWNGLVLDQNHKSELTREMDQEARRFYQNIRDIISLDNSESDFQQLLTDFKIYYIFATSVIKDIRVSDLEKYKQSLLNFKKNRDNLNATLNLTTEKSRNTFADSLKSLERDFTSALFYLIIFGLLITILSFSASVALSRRLTQPIEYLTDIAQKIGQGEYNVRIAARRNDEFQILIDAFNRMAESIQSTLHSLQQESLTRRQAEQDLSSAKGFLDNVINSITSLLLTIDSDCKINLYNDAARQCLSLESDHQKKSLIWESLPFLKEYKSILKESMKHKQKKVLSRVQYKSDKIIYYDITVYPLQAQDSIGSVIILDDVTDMIKKDETIRQMQKMETVGILSGGLAHDFNNILTVILNTNSLMKYMVESGNFNTETVLDLAQTTETAADKAAELVKNLLSLTRKQELKFQLCDLNKIINEITKMAQRTFDKSVEIVSETYPQDAFTSGDATQLGQVLLNICINSWHAMTLMRAEGTAQGGRLNIGISKIETDSLFSAAHPQATDTKYWVLSIRDTGVGMNKDTLDRIFDPFYTTKENGVGTGLGLSIVYNVVQLHQGFIDVYSELGVGTEVKIYLPILRAEPEADKTEQDLFIINQGLALVIDDEDMIRKSLGSLLSVFGFRTIASGSGIEAIEVFRSRYQEISLVILDMSMPGLSGYDTFYKLKEISKEARILLHSGFKDEKKVGILLQDGARGFLQKPYTLTELSGILKKIL